MPESLTRKITKARQAKLMRTRKIPTGSMSSHRFGEILLSVKRKSKPEKRDQHALGPV
jgi:hypothetical protein